jgi:replicative DNA helicase
MNIFYEYEKQLMGRIIASPDEYYANADTIHEELFDVAKEVFRAFTRIIKMGKHPSLIRLTEECPANKNYILESVETIDYNIPIEDMVTTLDENRKLRFLKGILADAAHKDTSEEIMKVLSAGISAIYAGGNAQVKHGYDIAKDVIGSLFSGEKTGVPTGVSYFDAMTGGVQPSDLIIIAADPSQGKTSLALNICQNMLDLSASILIVSLEMSERQLMSRMIAAKAETSIRELKHNYPLAEQVASTYHNQNIFIADTPNSDVHNIVGIIRSAKIRHNIQAVVIDYLQLLTSKARSREEEVGQTARLLKNLAKELNIPIILLSQLNRAKQGSDPFPTLRRLRDSGQIEEAADIVWFIYRPEEYDNSPEYNGVPADGLVIHSIAKGRNYGTGQFEGHFKKEITKFYNSRSESQGYGYKREYSDNDSQPY